MAMTSAVERYTHHGVPHTRVPATAGERWIVGVDLGQSTDPTAIAVLHWRRAPLDNWTTTKRPDGSVTHAQDCETCFDVRHLQRLPLGTSYPVVVQSVADILVRPPLRGAAELVIDETGVGRAVGDLFDVAGLKPVRVNITAGNEVTEPESGRHHVAKSVLISTLDARLHCGQLKFAAALSEAPALQDELKDFRRKVSEAGRATYAARTGKHDDLVLAVAIATWWASQPERKTFISTVRGLG